jgi:hypothetical protein
MLIAWALLALLNAEEAHVPRRPSASVCGDLDSQPHVGLTMRLDVFGQFRIDLLRENGQWQVRRVGMGMSAPVAVTIPSELDEDAAIRYLEDLWHESSKPGARITRVAK